MRQRPQANHLAAREDGRQQRFAALSQQDDDHRRGRLLQRFEQRVGRGRRRQVHIFDNENLALSSQGGQGGFAHDTVANQLDAEDACLGRRRDQAQIGMKTACGLAARRARFARSRQRVVRRAQQRAGKTERQRHFADVGRA